MSLGLSDPGDRLAPDRNIKLAVNSDNQMTFLLAQTATGTNQATALMIPSNVAGAEFTTVTSGTGAQLPLSQSGQRITIANGTTTTLTVYTNSGEVGANLINTTAGATGVTLTSGKSAIYTCFTKGTWYQTLSA